MAFNPMEKAEQDGKAWAAQFHADGDPQTLERLRELVANAYSAGWLEGWSVALTEAKAVLEGTK